METAARLGYNSNGELHLDWKDQIIAESAVTHEGAIKYGPARERIEGKN